MYEGKRLITPESRGISRGEAPVRKKSSPLSGLVIESAEGVRFAYTETQIRSVGRPLAEVTLSVELQTLQNQRLEEIGEIKVKAEKEE